MGFVALERTICLELVFENPLASDNVTELDEEEDPMCCWRGEQHTLPPSLHAGWSQQGQHDSSGEQETMVR
jgi:hypothetical protein